MEVIVNLLPAKRGYIDTLFAIPTHKPNTLGEVMTVTAKSVNTVHGTPDENYRVTMTKSKLRRGEVLTMYLHDRNHPELNTIAYLEMSIDEGRYETFVMPSYRDVIPAVVFEVEFK
jgi:hypothetical protein